MRRFIGGAGQRLLILVGVLVVLGGAAGYIWYQRLVYEGVISFDSDPDITTWDASKVDGLRLSPHGLGQTRIDEADMSDARYFHFKVHNNSQYEISTFYVELKLYDAGGEEVFSEIGRCTNFVDERTMYVGTLLPHGLSESQIQFHIPASVIEKYENNGRLEHTITDVELYQDIGIRNKLSHFLACVTRGDTVAVRNSLSKWHELATATNDRGIGAMWIASALNNVEMLSLLAINGAPIELGIANGRDNIHIAAYNGSTDAIQYLVSTGADIDLLDGNGETALHIAVTRYHRESAKYLIGAGADITILNTTGVSPLHLACWMRNLELVEALVAAGADIEELSSKQSTPLLYAANTGSVEIMEFLLAQGADIRVKDETNSNIVSYVVFSENIEAVRFVLTKNFDLSVTDDDGKTAYDYALEHENKEIAALVKP